MKVRALGVIETFGLVPAIEAADTGLKTADVSVGGLEKSGAGLVAVMLRGDVSSVKAAVEAGSQAAERLGRVVSTTVIARTAEGLECLLPPDGHSDQETPEPFTTHGMTSPAQETTGLTDAAPLLAIEQLRKLNVVRLRTYVRTLPGYQMTREEIRSARKKDLLIKIADYYRGRKPSHD